MAGRRSPTWLLVASLCVGGCATTLERADQARAVGDDAQAEQLYRDALASGREDEVPIRAALVELLIERGTATGKQDPAAAEAIFEEVLALDPASSEGRLGLARTLLRQDRQPEALALLDEERCNGCGRLLAVLLVERGQEHLSAKRWAQARTDFQAALDRMPDAAAALGVVESWLATDAAVPAIESMEKGVPLIKVENTEAQRRFVDMRRRAVLAAAKHGDMQTVDRWFALGPPGGGGDEWFALQLDVARERADFDLAIERMARVLEQNAPDLAPARRSELERFLVDLYTSRAARSLRTGEVAKAENDLTYALRIDADNWTVKLMRVLAVVALGKLDHGFRMLKKVPPGTAGRDDVLAILWSLRVNERLALGDLAGARTALAQAQQTQPDMPEVHVAAAQVLALTPLDGVGRAAEKELRKRGMLRYPAGQLNRYGEALSEIDWARKQVQALGPRFPFQAASTEERMRSLEQQIRAFYPFGIEFQAEASTVLVLRAGSGTHAVVVEAPGGFRQEVSVSDAASASLSIPEPGLTRLKLGKQTLALITEPYTRLTADL